MGFFDFIKKKKTEEHEVPQVPVRPPVYEEEAAPITPSQLFDEEPADSMPQASLTMHPLESGNDDFTPEVRQATVSMEGKVTEVYVEPVGGELAQELSEEAEFLPEQEEDIADADTEDYALTEETEEELAAEDKAADEPVLAEPEQLPESEQIEEEPVIEEMEDSGDLLPEREQEVLVDLEEDVQEIGALAAEERAEEPEPLLEEEPEATQPEEREEPQEPERAAAFTEETKKKKFLFFGSKKEEPQVSAASVPEEEPEYSGDNKRIRELHRSVKDLREERSAFTNRFERTYQEQNKQINSSFNSLRGEIRQDINGIGKEFIAANNKANGQLSEGIREQNAAINALDVTVKEENNKTRSEVQMGFARNKVALTDMTETVQRLDQTQTEKLEQVDAALSQVSCAIVNQSEKSEQNKDEIVERIERNTAAILQRLTDGAEKDADLDAMTPAQHYKNMRYSVVSLLLSMFSAFLLITSLLQVLKIITPGGDLNPIVILDFLLVYLAAAGGIVLAMFQKKFFFARGMKTLKPYFKSKNPAHTLSKLSMLISFCTVVINTLLLFTVIIVFIVIALT